MKGCLQLLHSVAANIIDGMHIFLAAGAVATASECSGRGGFLMRNGGHQCGLSFGGIHYTNIAFSQSHHQLTSNRRNRVEIERYIGHQGGSTKHTTGLQ